MCTHDIISKHILSYNAKSTPKQRFCLKFDLSKFNIQNHPFFPEKMSAYPFTHFLLYAFCWKKVPFLHTFFYSCMCKLIYPSAPMIFSPTSFKVSNCYPSMRHIAISQHFLNRSSPTLAIQPTAGISVPLSI